MVRPWNEWLIVWGYDIGQPAPQVDEQAAIQIVRNLLGLPDIGILSMRDIVRFWVQSGIAAEFASESREKSIGPVAVI